MYICNHYSYHNQIYRQVAKALEHLAAADARLAAIIKSVGAYEIEMRKDPFQSLVEAIIYQQLAGSTADAIYGRFVKIYGRFPWPAQLLATRDARLRAVGLSARKIEYLKDLASRVSDGRPAKARHVAENVRRAGDRAAGSGKRDRQVDGRNVPDLLPWEAGCALPVDDLGLRRAMQKAYSLAELPSPENMRKIAQPWKPYCSVATSYLWKSLEKFKGIG